MHVRVRLLGKPDVIVVVESKLTKIEQFRRVVRDKFDVDPKLQRLFYGGKLLEDGYTFHDYNIKLNDVIQLMVKAQVTEEPETNESAKKRNTEPSNTKTITYKDAESSLYEVGDLVDMRDREQGAWFEGKVVRIVHNPDFVPVISNNKQNGVSSDQESDSENKPPAECEPKDTPPKTSKNKAIADYFMKITKLSRKKQSDLGSSTKETDNPLIEHGLLYQIHLDDDTETEHFCNLKEIRPRARKEIDVKDLKPGQRVMINHNTEDLSEKGYWYDFKVDEVKKLRTSYELIGTLYLGRDAVPQNDTKAKVVDKILFIEEVVPLAERSDEFKKLMRTLTERRSSPLNCLTCRDDEEAPCKDCGCFLCLGKEAPEKIILCDECNYGYHMACLAPPLSELPDEDWYCPSCKRDTNTVVAPGAAKQSKKANASKNTRDWGRGMACAGKTKTCAMPANHFGPIPGIEVGMCWRFRIQLSESGVHRPPVSGIHGRDVEGAYSIVLSGGYEDDYDNGDEFTYTGSGGRDLSGNKRTAEQSCDQTLTRENKALARNCAVKQVSEEGGDAGDRWREGRPVRVVRSFKMKRHFPQYAPEEGIRYDGIYKVAKYYPEKGKSGFRVWKYLLKRDDPAPAPWEPGAKHYPIIYPDGYLEAEAEKKVLKQKGTKPKKTKKRALRESNHSSDSEAERSQEGSPAPKKRNTRSSLGTPEGKKKAVKEAGASQSASPKTPKIASIFAAAKRSPKSKAKPAQADLDTKLSKEELEAIRADALNSKLWEECLDVCRANGKKEFVEHVTQVFLCIICQDVAACPVTTPCLHNFCMGCIKLAFKSTGVSSCPCCRRDLSREVPAPNEQLRAALQAVMPGYDACKK